jgi:pimeloyl-ACP methyl ester carboxylesterase
MIGRADEMRTDFVLLHGGGQGSWVWEETLAALDVQDGANTTARALDIPGCGAKRDHEISTLTVSEIVADLIAEIDVSGLQDIVLVGHSQAGTIMPLLVEARPALFRRLIYVSCLAPLSSQTALSWRADMPQDEISLLNDTALGPGERYAAMFCNDMADAARDRFLGKLGRDQWPASSYTMSGWRYDHLGDVPATYILCLRDAALLPSWQETFAERLQVQRKIVIDAGHQVMNTHPHALAEILRIEAGL